MWKANASHYETNEQRQARKEQEARAAIPTLSGRQFWLAALEVGVTKDGLLQTIELSNLSNKEALLIEVRESTSFSRDYDLVGILAEMKGIAPAEVDALWIWASAL